MRQLIISDEVARDKGKKAPPGQLASNFSGPPAMSFVGSIKKARNPSCPIALGTRIQGWAGVVSIEAARFSVDYSPRVLFLWTRQNPSQRGLDDVAEPPHCGDSL